MTVRNYGGEYEYSCWWQWAVWVGVGFGCRDTVKGNIKSDIKGNVTSIVKGDGQQCPSHTNKVKS